MIEENLFVKKDGKWAFAKDEVKEIEYERVTVNFEKEVAEAIKEIAKTNKTSVAKVVNDMAKSILADIQENKKKAQPVEKPKTQSKKRNTKSKNEEVEQHPGQVQVDEVIKKDK